MSLNGSGLSGKAAIVTGAAGGIGLHIARRLCRDGARVLLVDRKIDEGRRAASDLSLEGTCAFFHCDLKDASQAERVTEACLETFGQVDIVCNNAADLGRLEWIHLDDVDNWRRVLQTNLISPFLICKAAVAHMLARGAGGRIVNIASIQASMPLPRHGPYAASKGGLISFTKSLAIEYASSGIVANAIDVGCILSDAMKAILPETGDQESADRQGDPRSAATLNRTFGSPEEIAALVRFLVSDENTHIVGAVIRADGGRSISRMADPYTC